MIEVLDPKSPENILRIKSAGESMGKSGSFFFFSSDNSMLIKTMSDDDMEAF